MTARWKIAPMPKRPEDPHLDSFRSPTPKGHHPHAFPADNEVHNPQVMYEYREGFSPVKPLATPRSSPRQPVGSYAPPPAPPSPPPQNFFSFVAEHPFLTFGFGALVFYGLAKLKEKDAQARINPSYPLIANPSVVLAPGESSTVTAENCDRFGRPLSSPLPLPVSEEVQVKVQEAIKPAPAVKPKKEKIRRPGYKGRRTTQARDEDGKFLPAGTRKRAKTEGKK